MKRRNLFQLSAAALAATPALSQGSGAASGAKPAAAWQPAVFDEHQAETVAVLVGLIIPATDTPGAREAGVHRYMDLLLRDGDDTARRQFIEGISWIDGYAMRLHSKPFVRLAAAEQTALLRELDAGSGTETAPGTRFFRQFKPLTSRIYYATEAGFREMNKGGRVPASYGCRHAGHA